MNKIEELEKLLKTEVLIQVNEEIKTIKKLIGKQNRPIYPNWIRDRANHEVAEGIIKWTN